MSYFIINTLPPSTSPPFILLILNVMYTSNLAKERKTWIENIRIKEINRINADLPIVQLSVFLFGLKQNKRNEKEKKFSFMKDDLSFCILVKLYIFLEEQKHSPHSNIGRYILGKSQGKTHESLLSDFVTQKLAPRFDPGVDLKSP